LSLRASFTLGAVAFALLIGLERRAYG
jgi:hypothetical protein